MDLLVKIADIASSSLLCEVSLSPKPGLVDRLDSGAHDDMDFNLFVKSIKVLSPFFKDYISTGYVHRGSLPELFLKLRKIGKEAENEMMRATEGINTHKGANFSFAIILGAIGNYIHRQSPKKTLLPLSDVEINAIFLIVSEMCNGLTSRDFSQSNTRQLSHGEKIFQEHGLSGIRGEAEAGYPNVREKALVFARNCKDSTGDILLLKILLLLMSETEDGNIIHRGGIDAWRKIKQESKELSEKKLTSEQFILAIQLYNKELIRKNLSPGGAADLLAITVFFLHLENQIDLGELM